MKGKTIWGIIFIALGVIFLLNSVLGYDFISASDLWPYAVLALGVSFEISYFNKRGDPGVLVPGGILTVLGILFIFNNLTHGNFAEYTYPVYILSVAVGLFQLYWFDEKKSGLLIPIFILIAIAVFQYLSMFYNNIGRFFNLKVLFALMLIFMGFTIIFNKKNK